MEKERESLFYFTVKKRDPERVAIFGVFANTEMNDAIYISGSRADHNLFYHPSKNKKRRCTKKVIGWDY
jgi:hypothetical protein